MVDLPWAVFSFDIWAVTMKMKGHAIRIDGEQLSDEWAGIAMFLLVHLIVYVLSVYFWLVAPTLYGQVPIVFIALIVAFVPLGLLGTPTRQQTESA